MTNRNVKFSALIGGGIVAAGALLYFANANVHARATQGTIAHREVYRDGQVKAGDVGTPGAAPVAVKAVLENKDFRKLAKNQAFQELLNSQSFQQLAGSPSLWKLLSDGSFMKMAQNTQFQSLMQDKSFVTNLTQNFNGTLDFLQARLHSDDALNASQRQSFNGTLDFLQAMKSEAFQSLFRQDAFASLLTNKSFQSLAANPSFQNLVTNASFQNALMAGNAASLRDHIAQ